jgi:hypothetical protein
MLALRRNFPDGESALTLPRCMAQPNENPLVNPESTHAT